MSDLKTRKVSNKLWLVMAPIAVVVLITDLYLSSVNWRYYLILIPIGFLLVEALIERPPVFSKGNLNILVFIWFLVPVITLIYMLYTIESSMLLWSMLSILVMMGSAFVFYYFAIIYGGADAKAVVILAVLFPFYPEIHGITSWGGDPAMLEFMEVFFPFTFVILLNAAILALFLPVYYVVKNLKNGDLEFPQMFFGYKHQVDEIKDSFVWPMEYYVGNKRKIKLFPRGVTDDKLDSLKEKGLEKAWVTPKIPFLVFIFLGYLISYIIGNPTLYLFDWIYSLI
ncbi:MAG: A24 family peptidase C-terminal domain-containing protein [Thermoplasmatota archaeon]